MSPIHPEQQYAGGHLFAPAAREDFEHLNQRLFVDREFHLTSPDQKVD